MTESSLGQRPTGVLPDKRQVAASFSHHLSRSTSRLVLCCGLCAGCRESAGETIQWAADVCAHARFPRFPSIMKMPVRKEQ